MLDAGAAPVYSNGWPDFAVFGKDKRLKAVVEVKPEPGTRQRWEPRPDQVVMLIALASLGVPTFIWTPVGLLKFNKDGGAQSVSIDALEALF
jgi:hypothetical protein